MSEIRTTLERIERRVAMPEPAIDRMLGRRERRQRNERIAAAVTGLGVFVAGVVGAVLTLRVTGDIQPASGGGHPAASEGGGLVLPTVAIWTAIAVLALTAFAAVRLRARFADVDVKREGRGPGEAAASARRPAAAPDTAPWKGGTEMDSRPRTGLGTPQAEIAPIRFDEAKVRRANRWLTGAVIVLALAVVALGAALIVQSGNEAAPAPAPSKVGLADTATVKMIDALNKARTGDRVASFYTKDGVIDEVNIGKVTTGRAAIARHWQSYIDQGAWAQRIGPVIQSGDYVAQASLYNGQSLIVVYELTPDGKISHMWGIAN